jgi:hypothetical protein
MSGRACVLLALAVTAIGLGCVLFVPVTPPDAAFSARVKAYDTQGDARGIVRPIRKPPE